MNAAYRLKDPLSLPRATLDQLTRAVDPVVWLEPGTLKRKYLRRPPFSHHDPDGAEIFKGLGATEITYPPVFATGLMNATLIGFRTLLKDGALLTDENIVEPAAVERYIRRIGSADPHESEFTGLDRIDGSDSFRLKERTEAPVHLEQPTMLLSSNEPGNYGSFLFRILPKIISRRYLAKDCKILVSLPYKSMRRLLEICGIGESDVILHDPRKAYQLDRVIVPSVRNPHAFLDEVTVGLFDEIRTRVASATGSRCDLLFVSRRNLSSTKAGYRAMENEAELETCLEQLGFKTIHPETMSADEQVAAFASASLVVGQSGGAMFNVAFCRPGTIVIDIESEPHWIHAHMSYFSSLNLRYVIFEAKPLPRDERGIHRSFRVNVPALKAMLQEMLDNHLHLAGGR
jgi:capsular polysaccharide biosynthesis protein